MQDKEPPILAVPTEILLEIISYFTTTPIPYERYRLTHSGDEADVLRRFDLVRALSHTCRTFRGILYALVWETVEALPRALDHPIRHISLLKKRMMGILKTPSLPRCVRTVLVSLDLSAPNWNLLTIFARFLQATPNLSSLHIIVISDRHAGVLCERLESHVFHSVHTLTIPSSLSRTLSSFPNIRSLICAESFVSDYGAKVMLKAASRYCPLVEGLVNFMPSPPIIKCRYS
ncbi:hypothetical protein DFH09DRAFT_941621 [Mycena vulgaris]|nr:hypothetical protein DFH09DRAFT_941621 [Mycena vulgaris]